MQPDPVGYIRSAGYQLLLAKLPEHKKDHGRLEGKRSTVGSIIVNNKQKQPCSYFCCSLFYKWTGSTYGFLRLQMQRGTWLCWFQNGQVGFTMEEEELLPERKDMSGICPNQARLFTFQGKLIPSSTANPPSSVLADRWMDTPKLTVFCS